jgi:hypothetical protein
MIQRTLGSLAVVGLLMAGALQAHHSLAGVYDMKKEIELAGEVEAIKFTNPHGSLSIVVKAADGAPTTWVMTLGSATALAQRGVGKTGPNALHAGDAIKVKILPAKDGSPLGFLRSVTYADGHTIMVSGGGPNE